MWYSRFSNISNSPKVPRAKFLGIDGVFYFISIFKFDSFKNPFVTITSLSELYLRFTRRFVLLVQTKKVISVSSAIYLRLTKQIKIYFTYSVR